MQMSEKLTDKTAAHVKVQNTLLLVHLHVLT